MPQLSQQDRRRLPVLLALLIAGIGLLPTLHFAWWRISIVRGWEADAIARSVISGHGYSVPGTSHWLWAMWNGDPNQYFPTAWVDPVYTYVLAGTLWLFGAHAYFVMYGIAFTCLLVIFFCAFRVGSRFGGAWTGTLAVALIAFNEALGRAFFDDISNSCVATCATTVLALLSLRYFESPSRPRLIAMGLMTGLTVLTCPATSTILLFLPFAVAAHRIARDRAITARSVGQAAAVFALAAAIIAPWTIRNYATFGEFVLVRNGAGQIIWDGTVGIASTFIPDAAKSPLPPPWRSQGARDAVMKMMNKETRLPIHQYQVESVMAAPPPGYDRMNEAERDKFYLSRTEHFIAEHPLATLQMSFAKMEIFIARFGAIGVATAIMALVGAFMVISDSRSWPLTLLAISYCGPFILIVAYYGRYRAPIEPILAMLAAIGTAALVRAVNKRHAASTDPHPKLLRPAGK